MKIKKGKTKNTEARLMVCVAGLALISGAAAQAQPMTISTFAGIGVRGSLGGPALGSAEFYDPSGVAVDSASNVFVADTYNSIVRMISPDATGTNWTVSQLAGFAQAAGAVDGTNFNARFNNPNSLAVDGQTNIYVADTLNNLIRRIRPDHTGSNWVVTTLAGSTNAGSSDGTNSNARFHGLSGMVVDGAGRLYVADRGNDTIRKITSDVTGTNWVVTTIAGLAGNAGTNNGTNSAARFSSPNSIAIDARTNLYVADGGNYAIRKLTPDATGTNWIATTLAGGRDGSSDGTGTNASFNFPCGIAVDSASNIFISDFYNGTIRLVAPSGSNWVVTTVAGGGSGDGTGSLAGFNFLNVYGNPNGLATDRAGNLYIADTDDSKIRLGVPFAGLLLTASPQPQAVVAGQSVTFTVAAAGGQPITYQWFDDGAKIDGATNAVITLTDVQSNAAGSYSVLVSNPGHSTNSPAVVLTVEWPLAMTTFAGVPASGSTDGPGPTARFSNPRGVAVDAAGNVYVADYGNSSIRKVTPSGMVTTLAGVPEAAGYSEGTNGGARFSQPEGVAVDQAGNVYVADSGNHVIRKMTPDATGTNWLVTLFAGLPEASGYGGYHDGLATGGGYDSNSADFYSPYGVAVDNSYNVYVADTFDSAIRKIANNYVTTLAGGSYGNADGTGTNARFAAPGGIAVDGAGNIYVTDYQNDNVREVTPAGVVMTIASPAATEPTGIAADNAGNLEVANASFDTILRLTPGLPGANWTVTALAGDAGFYGGSDGVGLNARFAAPFGVAVDDLGNAYVGDSGNGAIRKVSPNGTVTTLAGPLSIGHADGTGLNAHFAFASGAAVDGDGNVYVADTDNSTIRRITPAGVVSTLAGTPGQSGSADGTNSAARFDQPASVALDGAGNLYVTDMGNDTIRKIAPDATGTNWIVTTLAGLAGVTGSNNGSNGAARFNKPFGIAVDAATNVYVGDYNNQTIRKLTPDATGTNWEATTYAGSPGASGYQDGTTAYFQYPAGLAVDGATNLYVADSGNYLIRKIAPTAPYATVSTLAGRTFILGGDDGNGTAAEFFSPQGVAVDAKGNVFVADTVNNTIREITPGGSVTTVAGIPGTYVGASETGSADGVGAQAQFNKPIGLAVDSAGNVYVADVNNNTIRKGVPYHGQPLICTPPQSLAVAAGGNTFFTATVAGASPLAYQWRFNGTNLPGATNATLVVSNARLADAGGYQLILSNGLGAATSAVVTLTVTEAPQITAQSGNQLAAAGAGATFSVSATGAPMLAYQWSFDGTNLPGKTASSLAIPDAQSADAGGYQVVITNAFGSVTGQVNTLTILGPPHITGFTTNPPTAECGSKVILSVTATGSPPLSYQWYQGHVAISNATQPMLNLNPSLADSGLGYSAVVSNALASVTSVVAVLTVVDTVPPVVTLNSNAVVYVIQGQTFTDPGATANDICAGSLPVTTYGSVDVNAVGTYTLRYVATDPSGNSATNSRAVNVVPAAPLIIQQPVTQSIYPGQVQYVYFTVAVTGATPFSYQWLKNQTTVSNGGDIFYATSSNLLISPVSSADAGIYSVIVSNSFGRAVSSNAVLVVGAAGTPIAVIGFNRDVVVENTASNFNTSDYCLPFDTVYGYAFYEAGLNAVNYSGGNATLEGLPQSGAFTSRLDGQTVFQLAPYNASNVLYLTASSPSATLTLVTPAAYDSLSIAACSADGGGAGTLAINFADGSSSSPISFNAGDWYNNAGAALTHFGRIYTGSFGVFDTDNPSGNNPNFYQTTINLAVLGLGAKPILSLTFTKPGASIATGIFAVSGTPAGTPPPVRISAAHLPGGKLTLSFATVKSQSYTVEDNTNLAAAGWLVYTNFTGDGSEFELVISATNRQQFFRVTEP